MSCSGSFHLKESSDYEKCSDTCKFDYKYDLDNTSQCKITKKTNYLDLNCWDRSKVVIGQDECSLREMRLYSPPMNKWGSSTSILGELILKHVSGEKNYYVCIPIKKSTSAGNGKEFFDSINNGVKLLANQNSVRVDLGGMYDLNNLIPKSKFYYSEGDGMDFHNNCLTSGSRVIIFPEEGAKGCSQDLISNIKNVARNTDPKMGGKRIVQDSKGHIYDNLEQKTGSFLVNEEGTKTTAGASDVGSSIEIECDPILDTSTGKNISGGKETSKFMTGEFKGVSKDKIWYYVRIILGIILAFFTIWLGWYIFNPGQTHPDPIRAQAGRKTSRIGAYIWKLMHKSVKN